MEAAYYNPNPIHVARAKASRNGDTMSVFVELRDEPAGYPGCIYRLDYDPRKDRLEGTYIQAATQQQFDVVFVRFE